jgi:hypothetical protein
VFWRDFIASVDLTVSDLLRSLPATVFSFESFGRFNDGFSESLLDTLLPSGFLFWMLDDGFWFSVS